MSSRLRAATLAVVLSALMFVSACGSGASSSGAAASGSTAGATLRAVRARGTVKCGITEGAGFATPDDAGHWRGFDVDFCRAIAVALFKDTNAVELVPFTQQQRFSGLQSREVDLLANGTSVTSSRTLHQPFQFGPIYLYDGQGFLVPKSSKVTQAKMLNGATICVQQGTTTELNLTDFARRNGIAFKPVVMEDLRAAVSALAGGRCDAISQDGAGLATTRTMLSDPANYLILPDRISKEPIAAVVRAGDDQWLELVNWVFRAPVQAEEYGINKQNVAQFAASADPSIRRFLGVESGATDGLGLDPKWVYNVIAMVGNYGDIYDRNLGSKTPLNMDRGLNKLWTDGGLLYSPPFR
ncbi:MAG TPA: amino acid ABC transporter substrate-binding protein [Gemmatimonadaceae bacterium]|nr:amino acid ABC transporter substrate-binding protein [Gemmatimonadaceae bacterium]